MAVLTAIAGRTCRVVSEQPLGHEWAPVTRLVLDRDLPGVGSSVVVKTCRVDGDGHGGPAFLRRETAGLRTATASGVSARLVHADDAVGVVIQTDLGDWPSLQDRLLANDPEAATAGMVELATAVGRLHASTLGRWDDHQRTLDAFGADVDTGLPYNFDAGRWDAIERACTELGLPAARSARDDVVQLLKRVNDPGATAALAHMDLNPTNVLITDCGACLVDFEGCRFGHPGIDAAFLHYPFPHHSNPWGLLPEAVIESADGAYRSALALGGADLVLHDYDQMLADGAAITLIGRISRLPLVASSGQSRHDSWRRRGQIVQQIRTYTQLAERAEGYSGFIGWLGKLETAMIDRWSDAADPAPPLFPAFAS
ncbi:phosphotransferase [Actinopolymorpha sp. B17G11]|uniref:phosphotransferase n=1 Tax=Actinopolymorpha sp. B17G11 TaxID=3160861 RepID=UPI0032E39E2C